MSGPWKPRTYEQTPYAQGVADERARVLALLEHWRDRPRLGLSSDDRRDELERVIADVCLCLLPCGHSDCASAQPAAEGGVL